MIYVVIQGFEPNSRISGIRDAASDKLCANRRAKAIAPFLIKNVKHIPHSKCNFFIHGLCVIFFVSRYIIMAIVCVNV